MELDFLSFFDACDPRQTLIVSEPKDRRYYVDFAEVRGGKIIEALERTILLRARNNQSTCQLFTGHIGCGKSTELRRLQANLEEKGFYVVYFESTEDLDMADVDITDILLAIMRQVSDSLEKFDIRIRPGYFKNLFNEVADLLQTPIEIGTEAEFSLPLGLGKITAQTKESPRLRSRLRQYLEPRTSSILESLNKEVLGRANDELISKYEKKGLVVIIDNLDRVDNRPSPGGRPQPEYLFVERGDQLHKLNCHVVYTIPLSLIFSSEAQTLTNRFGGGVAPKMLPMVPVKKKDGKVDQEGMRLLKQLIMIRAFPEALPSEHHQLVEKVFESPLALERLCKVSGGHIRNLLGMLYRCLQEEDTPISSACIERVIREYRDNLRVGIDEDEWQLLKHVQSTQMVSGDEGHATLLRSLYVFEYQDQEHGRWFGLNPLLQDDEELKP